MIEVAAAVITSGNMVFLSSRPLDKPPAGWEFPGGKLEAGETVQSAVIRELQEELDWQVTAGEILYQLHRGNLILHFIRCTPLPGSTPTAREGQSFRWVEITPEIPAELLANDIEFWKIFSARPEFSGKFAK